ncbi:hypothetical protein ISF_06837 [Cordyceps fumosorosea ARSEF 2679]|uniref:HAUS augmin-like complex subunit 6 N-terminal domain-containing protein n=1 Tax=Cordyceps fumosorosea (strain ARSEF 2679) TaxID=1081104 RepID=A0A167R5W3_CORFA|nr:hypothetical protein ISF_06837 [Cordyceps fumosorosea ARSEF 2679]OAA58298.1 hypothetical protein ISF_06837 [Cordyceps fumosorosea ARSEF 2679]
MHASPSKRRPINTPTPMAAAAQHSRTRSDRVGGSAAAPAAAPASRRPLSMHGRPPPPSPSPATASTPTTPAAKASAAVAPSHHPSPIPAFLTNLRLLDLDLRHDWPGITPATFAGTTPQNHKRRVQAVEWALYRLFEIWDPEDTASKLKPHFPAVDQLQSVSLRAALLRGLENAKKSGALGRDALIRKTMLDDCKGERLEEVLAAFSATVLRSTLAARGPYRPLAVKLAIDDDGHDDDGHLLRPLVLAHRASLRRSLDRRREAAARYRDFGDLLAMKERGLARRDEVLRARPAPAVSQDTCRRVRQTVRDNWSGNEAWLDALLAGDARGQTGALLGAPYDRVWRSVQQGRLAEIEDDARGGLLRQLDDRVEAQRQRLARWDELRRDMVGGGSRRNNQQPASSPLKRRAAAVAKPAQKGIDLRFNAHVDLHVGAAGVTRPTYSDEEPLHQHYATIMDELDQELTDIKTSSFEDAVQRLNNIRAQYGGGRADVSAHLSSDPISELSDLDEDEDVPDDYAPYRHHPHQHSAANAVPPRPVSMYAADRRTGYSEDDGYSSASTSHAGTLRATTTDWDASSASSPPTSGFFDDAQSPTKSKRHTLSLAERTRMSMARRSMQRLRDEEPEPEPLPVRTRAPPEDEEEEEEAGGLDLVSRTRMSMAGFERAQQRARSDRQREMRREMKRARALPPRREGSQWED